MMPEVSNLSLRCCLQRRLLHSELTLLNKDCTQAFSCLGEDAVAHVAGFCFYHKGVHHPMWYTKHRLLVDMGLCSCVCTLQVCSLFKPVYFSCFSCMARTADSMLSELLMFAYAAAVFYHCFGLYYQCVNLCLDIFASLGRCMLALKLAAHFLICTHLLTWILANTGGCGVCRSCGAWELGTMSCIPFITWSYIV